MKILVAEDERISARQLKAVLTNWGYDVVVVSDGLAAWNILSGPDAPQLAILDWMMPGKDGVELCRDIRKLRQEPYTYIVLLTEKSTRQDVVEGMNAGADDYLAKPFDAQELEARLRAGLCVLSLMDEVIAGREQLRHQATHDLLTGLTNRRAVRESLTQELARAGREQTSMAVALIDVDHFKQVNDTYGHLAGDAVLTEVGSRMRARVRSYDSVGRYGGEEFLIVIPRCDIHTALDRLNSLREFIAESPVSSPEGPIPVTASIGVTSYGGELATPDSLIQQADIALYRAKRNGRNRVEIFTPAETLCST
ncbi:MAG: diguanylate cyclase [Pirellulales bacterium]|nr:diguanylate cyclase [Pirellulales bacterium]